MSALALHQTQAARHATDARRGHAIAGPPWINNLFEGLSIKDIQTMHRVIIALRKKLADRNTHDTYGLPLARDSHE